MSDSLDRVRRRGRPEVWQRYGSAAGVGPGDRQIWDTWLVEGAHQQLGVLANAWKETVRDAINAQ
ncbi:MAG: hypothetical protein H0T78_07235 [Longispora sp.]|nr:hypothetical protein [Longispora sp. (in: high G+C Gram-positive bacteria)]